MNQSTHTQPESPCQQISLFQDTHPASQNLDDGNAVSVTNSEATAPSPPDLPQCSVYPLDAREFSEEQIAVAFAMTSRRPEPFYEIARQVSEEKAADFHERWVLGYGHASVAEHAVVHLAVENISRLACDGLEDNRLASYTEKSSRYQVIDADCFHTPAELDDYPALRQEYQATCQRLFAIYQGLMDASMQYLRSVHKQRTPEGDSAYNLRLRRMATDACRSVLPASTLTNVGVTANARTLEHAISKLMSSELKEERQLGEKIREQGRTVTPTLIKYADVVPYLKQHSQVRKTLADSLDSSDEREGLSTEVRLVHWDPQAEVKVAAALLYRATSMAYSEAWSKANAMDSEERHRVFNDFLGHRGTYDAPPRELESVDYVFEFLLDYGAFREFRRHRMQTYLPQTLTVTHDVRIPTLVADAGLEGLFTEATGTAELTYHNLRKAAISPVVAQYVVTHAHNRRLLSKMNLRECYHLFNLRTSSMAHESIREPMLEALRLVREVHPQLFRHLQLRD